MRLLYLDCAMGAAGDMLLGALLDLHPHPEEFLRRINSLGLPGVTVAAETAEKCGIRGTRARVSVRGQEEDQAHGHEHEHEHEHIHQHEPDHVHTGVTEILRLIGGLPVSERVREDAAAVYRLIARAEGKVHGREMDQIHFHEVGTLDAVADVVGVCLLMEEFGGEAAAASPVHVGSGQVRCAHGLLPVPAPATAELLKGVPIYGGTIEGELCTPTGAALLRRFARQFGPLPPMAVEAVGYGMGSRDYPAANCVRALLGESGAAASAEEDQIWELACNLDDMTGEDVAFACERLLTAGALDVWTAGITMKKGRPGVLLSCLCRPADRERMTALLLRHTTTLGVRGRPWDRVTLARREERRDTPYGPVRRKISEGSGVRREKAEFEDLAAIARREDLSLAQVRRTLEDRP